MLKQVKFTVVITVDNEQDVEQLHRDLYDVIDAALRDEILADGSTVADVHVCEPAVTLL